MVDISLFSTLLLSTLLIQLCQASEVFYYSPAAASVYSFDNSSITYGNVSALPSNHTLAGDVQRYYERLEKFCLSVLEEFEGSVEACQAKVRKFCEVI